MGLEVRPRYRHRAHYMDRPADSEMLLRTAALVDRAFFDQDGARQLGESLQVL